MRVKIIYVGNRKTELISAVKRFLDKIKLAISRAQFYEHDLSD